MVESPTTKAKSEITMARKNIDIILNMGHDGAHDFLERDERERSK